MVSGSTSYQCTWLSDGFYYTPSLIGGTGDIWQSYTDPTNPDTFTPKISSTDTDKRYLKCGLACSGITDVTQLSGAINDDRTKWYVDGKLITFGNNGVSASSGAASAFGGCFKRYKVADKDQRMPMGGLEVIGNLVGPSGGLPFTITCDMAVTVEDEITILPVSYGVNIFQSVGGQKAIAEIYCDSSQSFVLDNVTNKSVTCKARLWVEGKDATSGKFVRWYLLEGGTWKFKATAATFVVECDDIATFGQVKAEFYDSNPGTAAAAASTATMIASDIQTVADNSDPYIVYPNPTPADGRLRASSADNPNTTGVSFAPLLFSMSQNQGVPGALNAATATPANFTFTALTPAGTIVDSGTSSTKADGSGETTPWLCKRQLFIDMNFGPLVVIEATVK